MLIQFDKDQVLYPPQTETFGQLINGKAVELGDTDWFKQDKLGLKTLFDAGRLSFHRIDNKHLEYSDDHVKNIFLPFLKK